MKPATPVQTHWHDFYEAVEHSPPHETLLKALALFGDKRERFAIDLGCGSGRDTLELLRRGWRVLAVDRESEGIERLRKSVAHKNPNCKLVSPRLKGCTICQRVTSSTPVSRSLCAPTHFAGLWEMIVCAIGHQPDLQEHSLASMIAGRKNQA